MPLPTVRSHGMSSRSTTGAQGEPRHAGGNIYIAFVPWVLFTVITQRYELQAAAIIALVAAIIISFPSIRAGRPKALEVGAVVAFAAFTVVALTADAATKEWLVRYARGIAAGLLALIALGSLLRTPFTEQYARESVPQEFWSSERFKRVNRQLTLMWGIVFLLMVPSHVAAGIIDTHRGNTFFNWVIPIGLIVFAVKQTGRVTAESRREGREPSPV
jgi:hypothetical protein